MLRNLFAIWRETLRRAVRTLEPFGESAGRWRPCLRFAVPTAALALCVVVLTQVHPAPAAEAAADEHHCAPYERGDYPYAPGLEGDIVSRMGGRIFGPYTGRVFSTVRKTDIEHIVSLREAHDSGLCRSDREDRRRFAEDLLNLTLAAPDVNRCGEGGKCARDAGEWLPRENRCWFAARVIVVKFKYGLVMDRREAAALRRTLADCDSIEMDFDVRADE